LLYRGVWPRVNVPGEHTGSIFSLEDGSSIFFSKRWQTAIRLHDVSLKMPRWTLFNLSSKVLPFEAANVQHFLDEVFKDNSCPL
jgi:hypothetical protein